MDSQDISAEELSCLFTEEVCSLHGEKFGFICLEDKQPVCLVCRDSQEHTNHTFRTISEVAKSCKRELRQKVYYQEMNLQDIEFIKEEFEGIFQHIESQAKDTERQIKQQFEKLHQFLRDEEEATITALREEEEQRKQMMKEKLEEVNKSISVLSDTIQYTEEMIEADDIYVIKEFSVANERVEIIQPEPEAPSGALIDVPRYLGNLPYRVWKKMQDIVQYTPVILDPNTANTYLFLSDDLTSVRNPKTNNRVPGNPERIISYHCVLGSEGFDSGTHCWDVEIKKSPRWGVGVTTAVKNEKMVFKDNVWCVCYSLPGERGISVKENLERVRVDLDYDGGTVSFSDPLTDTHLYTFTTTFTDTIFPFFCCDPDSCLRILPFNSQ